MFYFLIWRCLKVKSSLSQADVSEKNSKTKSQLLGGFEHTNPQKFRCLVGGC